MFGLKFVQDKIFAFSLDKEGVLLVLEVRGREDSLYQCYLDIILVEEDRYHESRLRYRIPATKRNTAYFFLFSFVLWSLKKV